ncbi:hypothetical protein NDU88_003023 [Pleurodeles waltl]|uniref:Uncharacterized protein n=1 Tax=Pleurodeles waltl TaxID=8319 RepID=A0AAV7LE30_PLEWA|nr:hypothetical protein NDU88_003023 [Pleurodeles waltl]
MRGLSWESNEDWACDEDDERARDVEGLWMTVGDRPVGEADADKGNNSTLLLTRGVAGPPPETRQPLSGWHWAKERCEGRRTRCTTELAIAARSSKWRGALHGKALQQSGWKFMKTAIQSNSAEQTFQLTVKEAFNIDIQKLELILGGRKEWVTRMRSYYERRPSLLLSGSWWIWMTPAANGKNGENKQEEGPCCR